MFILNKERLLFSIIVIIDLFIISNQQQIKWLFKSVIRKNDLIGQIVIGFNTIYPFYYFRTYFESVNFNEDFYGWSIIDYPFKWQESYFITGSFDSNFSVNLTAIHGRLSKRGFYTDDVLSHKIHYTNITGKSFIMYDKSNNIVTTSIILPINIKSMFKTDFNGLFEGQVSILFYELPNLYANIIYNNNISNINTNTNDIDKNFNSYTYSYSNDFLATFLFELFETNVDYMNELFQLILLHKNNILINHQKKDEIIGIYIWDLLKISHYDWYICNSYFSPLKCPFIDLNSISITNRMLSEGRFSMNTKSSSLHKLDLKDYYLIILKSDRLSSVHYIYPIKENIFLYELANNMNITIEQKDIWFPVYFTYNHQVPLSNLTNVKLLNNSDSHSIPKNVLAVDLSLLDGYCTLNYPTNPSFPLNLYQLFGNNIDNYIWSTFNITLNLSLFEWEIDLVHDKFLSSYVNGQNIFCCPFLLNYHLSFKAIAYFNNKILDGFVRFKELYNKDSIYLLTLIETNIRYYGEIKKETCCHNWHIHEYKVDKMWYKEENYSFISTGPHFNPTNINSKSNDYGIKCSKYRHNQCEVGDLNGRHGKININNHQNKFIDRSIHVHGDHSVTNRSICIHSHIQAKLIIDCASIIHLI